MGKEEISPLDEYLASRETPEWHKPQIGRYHASSLPYCLRKQYYKFAGLDTPYDARGNRAMWVGGILHRAIEEHVFPKVEDQFRAIFWEKEVFWGLPEHPEALIVGRFDALVRDQNGELAVLDVKTCKSISNVRKYGPSEHHIKQLTFYMGAMNVRRGLLWYVGRMNIEDKIIEVKYDDKTFRWMELQARLLHSHLTAATPPKPVPLYSWECNYCDYKSICPRVAADAPERVQGQAALNPRRSETN